MRGEIIIAPRARTDRRWRSRSPACIHAQVQGWASDAAPSPAMRARRHTARVPGLVGSCRVYVYALVHVVLYTYNAYSLAIAAVTRSFCRGAYITRRRTPTRLGRRPVFVARTVRSLACLRPCSKHTTRTAAFLSFAHIVTKPANETASRRQHRSKKTMQATLLSTQDGG